MHRLATITALLLFAAATARAVNSSYEARSRALREGAAAQRKKLGLDQGREKLLAQYPTPEVAFPSETLQLACGAAGTVKVAGKFVKGTSFLLNNDEVQVSEEKATASGWQAKVRIAQTAIPADVVLHALTPVSLAERDGLLLQIRGRYELDLKFEDGWSAHFATTEAEAGSGRLSGTLAWKKGTEAREARAEVQPEEGALRLRVEMSPEELQLRQELMDATGALNGEEFVKQSMARVEACLKKPAPDQSACMEEAGKANDRDGKAFEAKSSKLQAAFEAKRPTAAWG